MSSLHPLASASAAAPESEPSAHISAAKLAANKANAQLSTGPKSADGKANSSLNAIKTGLTGRTVLLATDDAAAYEQHLHEYAKDLNPVGRIETELVQSIADSTWRLQRIPTLEAAIYAQGRIQFANHFDDHDPATRASSLDEPATLSEAKTLLIELHTFLTYEKQLRNLHTQEARLHRRREKDLAELRDLQKQRKQNRNNALEAASRLAMLAKRANQPFDLAAFGFEFTMDDLEHYIAADPVSQITRTAIKHAVKAAKISQSAA